MKIILLIVMTTILIALFVGLFFLMKEQGPSKKALRALIVRVGLSVMLILLLIVSFYAGWLTPHAIGS